MTRYSFGWQHHEPHSLTLSNWNYGCHRRGPHGLRSLRQQLSLPDRCPLQHCRRRARIRFAGSHADYDKFDATRAQVMLRAIKTARQHKAALKLIDALMDVAPHSTEANELEVLAVLVERYKREAFPIGPQSPVDAIRFRMEQTGYSQADLARLLNSRSQASELLTGSARRLSLNTIRRLHRKWRIPAEVLIRGAA